MSESFFVNEHIREFASAHPHEAGWNLYEFPGEAARRRRFITFWTLFSGAIPNA